MLKVSSFSSRAYLSLSVSLSASTLSLRDAATSVQFNSSLIHVLRVNGNKLSKLFEPPTGLRQRQRWREEGPGGCYSCLKAGRAQLLEPWSYGEINKCSGDAFSFTGFHLSSVRSCLRCLVWQLKECKILVNGFRTQHLYYVSSPGRNQLCGSSPFIFIAWAKQCLIFTPRGLSLFSDMLLWWSCCDIDGAFLEEKSKEKKDTEENDTEAL